MTPDNIHPHHHTVDRQMRSSIKEHKPLVIWLTGLSGSGKSTIANALEYQLVSDYHVHTYLLDGDNIRSGLNTGLGFSNEDRKENIRRVGEVAKLLFDSGLIVITAFISPFSADREKVRNLFSPGEFWEVFVSCPLETCVKRDTKGLYKKALKGEISSFTGVDSGYEIPDSPELVINTDLYTVGECVDQVITLLKNKRIINSFH